MRLLTLFAALLCAAPVLADEVEERLKQALALYGQGKYRQSVEELQFAITEIQAKRDASYTALLPEPLAGWEAEEASIDSAGMGMFNIGAQVSRDYRESAGNGRATVQVLGDSPMVAALSMMIANPMLAQLDPASRPYRKNGHPGLIKHEEGTTQWEITLLVGARVLITVTTEQVEDQSVAEDYLEALDMHQLLTAFGL